MSNLIPLHIDKNSGAIVAKQTAGSSGLVTGYTFEQTVPTASWLIVHNKNTRNLLCQIYDPNGHLLIPDDITIININTISVNFTTPIIGSAHILFFGV